MKPTFGQLLRHWRLKRGYGRWQFAQLVGLSNSASRHYEIGKLPRVDVFDKMLRVLEVTYDEFWSVTPRELIDPPKICEHFGENLRYWRQKRGLTGKQLGKALGISDQRIFDYETQPRQVLPLRFDEILEVLGVSYEEFMRGGTEK